MAIHSSEPGHYYGNYPYNYLLHWARRTGNVADIDQFYVQIDVNSSNGNVTFSIRDMADLGEGATNPTTSPLPPHVPPRYPSWVPGL